MEKAQKLFDPIWEDYLKQNPEVKKVYDLFSGLGEDVENDHIAFRTFNDKRIRGKKSIRSVLRSG